MNDVAGPEESAGEELDALRALVAERHAILDGILLFGVIDAEAFRRCYAALGVPARWLVTARWQSHVPGVDCPGCKKGEPLTPIRELG